MLRNKRMLHFAPELWFEKGFREQLGAGYITADYFKPADVQVDITDIPFDDEVFDIVLCSHVLEHVPDDRQAMHEIRRILKPEGWAILMVPITVDKTVEDPSVTDPKERLRLFGQNDHVRRYGPDFVERLQESGLKVEIVHPSDVVTEEEMTRLAIGHGIPGDIFRCSVQSLK